MFQEILRVHVNEFYTATVADSGHFDVDAIFSQKSSRLMHREYNGNANISSIQGIERQTLLLGV